MDFSGRAKLLKGRGAEAYNKQQDLKNETAKMGLTQTEYWKTMVHTHQDALLYMDLYHPEYPDCLKEAYVQHIESLMVKCSTNSELYNKHVLGTQEEEKQQYKLDAKMQELGQLAYQRDEVIVKRTHAIAQILKDHAIRQEEGQKIQGTGS